MSSNITPPPKAAKFIFAATIAVIILIALGTVRQNSVFIIMGVVLIMVIFGFAITAEKGARSDGGKVSAAQLPVQYGKYVPILTDERTKQHPEVQRLLQYTEVQRAFFDPSSLSKPATANDEHVRELLAVLDEMLAQGVINGTVYGAQNIAPSMNIPAQTIQQMQPIKPEEQKSTPKRKLGLVLQYIGLLMFFLPFLSVIFIGIAPEKTSSMVKVIPVVVTTGAPLGMLLVAIGKIIRRR